MAPSLVGTHRLAVCRTCGLQWPVAPDGDPVPATTLCFHCGQAVTLASDLTPGDVVRVQPIDLAAGEPANVARSDLVAVRWDGRDRVKRILGMPSDCIGLQGSVLTVNDHPLEDTHHRNADPAFLLPWMLVDEDRKRSESRWQSANGWDRQKPGTWKSDGSGWLVYHHHSHHDMNRASPIWDDYPFNVNVNRKLHMVDRLGISFHVQESKEVSVDIAFWMSRGNHTVTFVTSQGHPHMIDSVMVGVPTDAPVDQRHPVAIRSRGPIQISDLKLERRNQYRIRPTDARSHAWTHRRWTRAPHDAAACRSVHLAGKPPGCPAARRG